VRCVLGRALDVPKQRFAAVAGGHQWSGRWGAGLRRGPLTGGLGKPCGLLPTRQWSSWTGPTNRRGWGIGVTKYWGSSLPCHKRAMHSSPHRSPRDSHGQRPRDATCIVPRSPGVMILPDLALQAGGQRGLSKPSNRTALRAFSRLLRMVFWQIFWQAPLRARSRRLFVLVGVTGIEPVTSAV
jgi:hypothetical protein